SRRDHRPDALARRRAGGPRGAPPRLPRRRRAVRCRRPRLRRDLPVARHPGRHRPQPHPPRPGPAPEGAGAMSTWPPPAPPEHPDELLSAYLDDELTVAERAYVDDHVATCPSCRAALEEER